MQLPNISDDVRVDTGVIQSDNASVHYDPMIAKLIAQGPNREVALQHLIKALHKFQVNRMNLG